MKRMLQFLVVLLLSILFAQNAFAQGSISWDSGYPKTGSTSGTISVSGSVALDSGWNPAKSSVTISAWKDGDQVFTGTAILSGSGSSYT